MKGLRFSTVGCAIAVLLLAIAAGGAQSKDPASVAANKFVGMWQLVSFENGEQERAAAVGAHPTGLLVYDASGLMSVQIMPDRTRHNFSGSVSLLFSGPQPSAAEALDAVTGYSAYFGTYSVNEREGTVTHHRQGNLYPGAIGEVVRRYTFVNDSRVSLVPVDNQNNRLVWERVKGSTSLTPTGKR